MSSADRSKAGSNLLWVINITQPYGFSQILLQKDLQVLGVAAKTPSVHSRKHIFLQLKVEFAELRQGAFGWGRGVVVKRREGGRRDTEIGRGWGQEGLRDMNGRREIFCRYIQWNLYINGHFGTNHFWVIFAVI